MSSLLIPLRPALLCQSLACCIPSLSIPSPTLSQALHNCISALFSCFFYNTWNTRCSLPLWCHPAVPQAPGMSPGGAVLGVKGGGSTALQTGGVPPTLRYQHPKPPTLRCHFNDCQPPLPQ